MLFNSIEFLLFFFQNPRDQKQDQFRCAFRQFVFAEYPKCVLIHLILDHGLQDARLSLPADIMKIDVADDFFQKCILADGLIIIVQYQ